MPEESSIVRAQLPDGTLIGVQAVSDTGAQDIGVLDVLQLDDLGKSIAGIAKLIGDGVKHAKPSSTKIEFGLDAKVEGGKITSLLVGGSGSASIKITMEWTEKAAGASG